MAYAVVVSLKQTLEPLLDSGRSRIKIPNSELKLIHDDLCYLKSFFDKVISLEDSISVEEVDKQIKDVVQKTQDLVESHLWDLVHSGSESSSSGFSGELVEVKGKLGSLIKVLRAKEDYLTVTVAGDKQSPSPLAADVAVSSEIHLERNNRIVGLDDELTRLLELVVGGTRRLQVISIVGMAGIGKTTLAQEVYLHPLTFEHFDIRLFAEVGVEYELKILLLRLHGQVVSKEWGPTSVDELGLSLHKYLFGRRYLIVLDDIWDIGAWEEIRRFLPDNDNGSRIILTTTMTDLARAACDEANIIQKCFLTNEDSWKLLCEMAFSDMMDCPLELEEIGKTIVQKSGGLPLAIVTIGKLLSKSARTAEKWMAVAQNIDSSVQETNIPMVLNLTYTQLPQHLKACFLYLGLFPPNYNIPTSLLIKLWVAEGFIQPVAGKSLEQKADEYLVDLVSRNLVIVHELSSTGRIKTCRIHQFFRDLCISEARQEKLFHIVNEGTTSSREDTRNRRRLGIQNDVALGVLEPVAEGGRCGWVRPHPPATHHPQRVYSHRRQPHPLVPGSAPNSQADRDDPRPLQRFLQRLHCLKFRIGRRRAAAQATSPQLSSPTETNSWLHQPSVSGVRSLVLTCPRNQHPLQLQVYPRYRWLRVLHAVSIRFGEFPHEVVKLVRLRYLAITCHGELPSSISRLWNLEVLIIHPTDPTTNSSVFLPLEIWKLHKLRHLQCMGFDLPDPSAAAAAMGDALKKLQTLSGVSARTCTEGVLGRMPNLIKLGILLDPTDLAVKISSCFHAVLTKLHYLESFKCAVMNRGLQSKAAFSLSGFSADLHCLKSLSLRMNGKFEWEEEMLENIGSLRLLQKLKLVFGCFKTGKWEIGEGQFPNLKYLQLFGCIGLKQWKAEDEGSSIFPCLEQLRLIGLDELEEIPREIGDIPTLQVITLERCSSGAVISMKYIVVEQMELQGDLLPFHVEVVMDSRNNQPELLALAGPNFKVGYV